MKVYCEPSDGPGTSREQDSWVLTELASHSDEERKGRKRRGDYLLLLLVIIIPFNRCLRASQVALVVKSSPANEGDARDMGLSLSWEDPLEDKMVTHFSILAW